MSTSNGFEAPEAVVRRQVDAFNRKDLDAFLATYSPNAGVDGTPRGRLEGAVAMRDFYAGRLDDPSLYCDVTTMVVLERRWVVAHERISSSSGAAETVAVFDVRDWVIQSSTLIKG